MNTSKLSSRALEATSKMHAAIETVRDRVGYPDTRMGKIKALGKLVREKAKPLIDILEDVENEQGRFD